MKPRISQRAWDAISEYARHDLSYRNSHIARKARSEAWTEGRDAKSLGNAINPYRRALKAVADPESQTVLRTLAECWDRGFVSAVTGSAEG
jgi:hypothetical protein